MNQRLKPPLVFLAVTMLCLLAVYYTGTLAPQYGVIEPESTVQYQSGTLRADEVAARFEPLLKGEQPAACWFEALKPQKLKMAILYRFAWPDEKHPVAALDRLYAAWRRVYFGSVEDIEYVWVEVDLGMGRPARIAYESPRVGKVFVSHDFQLKDAFPAFDTHPVLNVASWNHIFEVDAPGGAPNLVAPAAPAPLQYLDDAAYRDLRMGRRSLPPTVLLVHGQQGA